MPACGSTGSPGLLAARARCAARPSQVASCPSRRQSRSPRHSSTIVAPGLWKPWHRRRRRCLRPAHRPSSRTPRAPFRRQERASASWHPISGESALCRQDESSIRQESSESSRRSSLSAGRSPRKQFDALRHLNPVAGRAASGWPISVTARPCASPRPRPWPPSARPGTRHLRVLRRNAPEPVFTSSTRASRPAASFLLRIDAQIRPGLSTVPVRSRSA